MKEKNQNETEVAHVRLSRKDMEMVDSCAKIEGLSRSAFLRKIICEKVSSEMADHTISHTEKIVRTTLEQIIDIKFKNTFQVLRELLIEVQRANIMELKNYIERHPGLDISEYRTFYYQSEKESFELLSGRKSFEAIFSSFAKEKTIEGVPEWLKFLTDSEEDE